MELLQRFSGLVKLDGVNPYVDVPSEIWRRLGGAGSVPVLVRVRGPKGVASDPGPPPKDAERLRMIGRFSKDGWFRTTVLSRSAEPARLFLDRWMRETAGVSVGDTAVIQLRIDPESRELDVPMALQDALIADRSAGLAWERLSPSRQREILRYLSFLKTPVSLDRNVKKVIASLKGSID